MFDAVEHVFGNVFGIDQERLGELLRNLRVPTHAQQHFQIARGRHERALVFGWKRLVDPAADIVCRDADALPALAEGNADGCPGERNEPRRHLPFFRPQRGDERQRAAVAAEHVDSAIAHRRRFRLRSFHIEGLVYSSARKPPSSEIGHRIYDKCLARDHV